MKAVCYLRVSTLGQLEGDGFDRQLDASKRYAAANDIELVQVFEERGVSGKTDSDERPAFQQMVAALLENGCRMVLVEALDRVAREYRVQEQLLIYLASKGIDLTTANTGECVTQALMGDPMRRAMVQIQGVFAELDRNLLVNKLRKARERVKATTGRCEGRLPYGTRPNEATTITRMRQLRAEGRTYQAVAFTLNTDGLKPRNGKAWNPGTIYKILRGAHSAA